jgi:chloride channel protein, CIC family
VVPEFLELGHRRLRPQARLLGLSLLVGVVAGIGAILFFAACQVVFHYALDVTAGYHSSGPGGEPPLLGEGTGPLRPWLLLVVPLCGGILSGVLVYTLAPEAEGHGTDAAVAAYHHHQGRIRPRVPIALHWGWPGLVPHPAAFVIVGMAGFFAAAAKTPLSTLVMVSELTGN